MWQCQPRYGGHEKGGKVTLKRGEDSGGGGVGVQERNELRVWSGGDSVGCQGVLQWGHCVALTTG